MEEEEDSMMRSMPKAKADFFRGVKSVVAVEEEEGGGGVLLVAALWWLR